MESEGQDSAADKAFFRAFEELLQLPSGSLQGFEALKDVPGWDSVAVVEFMALADEKYGVALSPRQFRECRSVQDLAALVTAR
jgi:hypothetical protein